MPPANQTDTSGVILSRTATTRLTPELDSFLDAECQRLRLTRSEYLRLFVANQRLERMKADSGGVFCE